MAKPKPGTAQVNVELPEPFLDAVKAFAEARGEKLREVIYHALRRHLKYPPPSPELPAEPLPPAPVPAPDEPAPEPKKAAPKPRARRKTP